MTATMNNFEATQEFLRGLKSCNIHNLDELTEFLKTNKIKVKPYLEERLKKADCLTGSIIIYKSPEQYLTNFFEDKLKCRKYFNSLSYDDKINMLCCMYESRRFVKGITKVPCELESKTLPMPSISYLIANKISLEDVFHRTGLRIPYNYATLPRLMEKDHMTVICDTREKKPLSHSLIDFVTQSMRFGDYAAMDNPHKIFIERKSLTDFCGTFGMHLERFQAELDRAKAVGAKMIVLVESPLRTCMNYDRMKFYWRIKLKPEFLFHNVRDIIQKNDHVQFLFVDGRKHASEALRRIYCYADDPFNYDLQFLYNVNRLC